jgi:hypothetical protein
MGSHKGLTVYGTPYETRNTVGAFCATHAHTQVPCRTSGNLKNTLEIGVPCPLGPHRHIWPTQGRFSAYKTTMELETSKADGKVPGRLLIDETEFFILESFLHVRTLCYGQLSTRSSIFRSIWYEEHGKEAHSLMTVHFTIRQDPERPRALLPR